MRRATQVTAGFVVAMVAFAAFAAGITLDVTRRYEFTNCAAAGSAAQTLAAGSYLMRVTTEDVWVCFAASGSTCVTGGEKFPTGMAMMISVANAQRSVSCRSDLATGDVIFTGASE